MKKKKKRLTVGGIKKLFEKHKCKDDEVIDVLVEVTDNGCTLCFHAPLREDFYGANRGDGVHRMLFSVDTEDDGHDPEGS